MGLRFRKSISLIPGVKMNFGLKSMSISAGVPGFRKTINTNGRVTTSVGIPGTGLYYTESKKINPEPKAPRRSEPVYTPQQTYDYPDISREEPVGPSYETPKPHYEEKPKEEKSTSDVSYKETINSICKSCDDTVDWTEVMVSELPPDSSYNAVMWKYYHEVAKDILRGDIDTYLKVISDVNPLSDLLEYGSEFEFGTDDSHKIEVEFKANEEFLSRFKGNDYNVILQDYICSISIRIARDMFALLPVREVFVHCVLNNDTVLSVKFDRATVSSLNYGYIDPSDTLDKFLNNMKFNAANGFSKVSRLT